MTSPLSKSGPPPFSISSGKGNGDRPPEPWLTPDDERNRGGRDVRRGAMSAAGAAPVPGSGVGYSVKMREGSWWSRTWGWVALVGFALHLGGALYEATGGAPLWPSSAPASVTAWAASPLRVDSSGLFHPLVSLILTATTIAWISSLTTPGRRRW